MREVPGCVCKGDVVRGCGTGAEYAGATTLLTVGAMKFRTFVVGVFWSSLSAGGTIIIGTVWLEVFCGSACVTPVSNDWTQVAGSCGNGDGRGYDS